MTERQALIATTITNMIMAVAAVGSLIAAAVTVNVMIGDQQTRDEQFREERLG